jgi:hypothetical protein
MKTSLAMFPGVSKVLCHSALRASFVKRLSDSRYTSSLSFTACLRPVVHVKMFSISDIRLETHLGKDSTSSNNSNYGSRGALAWTPPASMEGSTPTWTEGTPSFTESSSSENGEIGNSFGYDERGVLKV